MSLIRAQLTPQRLSLYHGIVAALKSTKSRTPKKKSALSYRRGQGKKTSEKTGKSRITLVILFWLVFIIFLFGLFLFNRESVTRSIEIIKNVVAGHETPEKSVPDVENVKPVSNTESPTPVTQQPANETPAETAPSLQTTPPQTTQPEILPSETTQPQTIQPETTQSPQAELRERVLYFIQVDRSGYIIRVQTNRNLPVSESPLTDAIQAIIAGPNENEKNRGLISLVPPGTKILSAAVRGDTAYISFSEDFQYNTYGMEGYAGQLRQIVFTATEFPNIRDVQILIEGRRIDYLGEGIWIGSPINREML